jgi:hypothetical protein
MDFLLFQEGHFASILSVGGYINAGERLKHAAILRRFTSLRVALGRTQG